MRKQYKITIKTDFNYNVKDNSIDNRHSVFEFLTLPDDDVEYIKDGEPVSVLNELMILSFIDGIIACIRLEKEKGENDGVIFKRVIEDLEKAFISIDNEVKI